MLHLLSDCFSRVSTATKVSKKDVVVLNSSLVKKSLHILVKLGYIRFFKIISFKYLKVYLKYFQNSSVLRGASTLSKPSLKFYVKYKNLQRFTFNNRFSINGFIICSTSKGLLTDIECILSKIGGKALFYVC